MGFDISRLRRSDQVIGVSAIALFIFMFFFKWYGGSASASVGGVSVSSSSDAWNTFQNSRWLWLITIVVALAAVAISAGALELKSPVQPSVLVAGLGALSTALILYRIVHHPSGGASSSIGAVHYSYSYGIKLGIWLGLIAAAGIAYGGYLAMRDEGTSLADVREQASGAISGLSASVSGADAPSAGDASAATVVSPVPGTAEEGGAPPLPPPAAPPGAAS
ncbi:MAG TPA: hypothetical protein VK272_11420 [Solirubrobacteraceae bacterium]|nr:hypothetical protein [Solirubrobacteraceae bacterium]